MPESDSANDSLPHRRSSSTLAHRLVVFKQDGSINPRPVYQRTRHIQGLFKLQNCRKYLQVLIPYLRVPTGTYTTLPADSHYKSQIVGSTNRIGAAYMRSHRLYCMRRPALFVRGASSPSTTEPRLPSLTEPHFKMISPARRTSLTAESIFILIEYSIPNKYISHRHEESQLPLPMDPRLTSPTIRALHEQRASAPTTCMRHGLLQSHLSTDSTQPRSSYDRYSREPNHTTRNLGDSHPRRSLPANVCTAYHYSEPKRGAMTRHGSRGSNTYRIKTSIQEPWS
jgi:hypothetical protein